MADMTDIDRNSLGHIVGTSDLLGRKQHVAWLNPRVKHVSVGAGAGWSKFAAIKNLQYQ